MTKKTGPYVGVTGFMSREEVEYALSLVPENENRKLMVGVLVSNKTLTNEANIFPNRYPEKGEVEDIFVQHPRALNLVHYHTTNPQSLAEEMKQVVELAGPNLDGFQINLKWPPPSQLKKFLEDFPKMYIVLQIGEGALAEVKNSPIQLVQKIQKYIPWFNAVLIDPSGGSGTSFDVNLAKELFRAIRKNFEFEIGIAGGLSHVTLHSLDSLIQEFSDFNIDAEGQLRTSKPEDKLCLEALSDYLADAFPILAGKELPGIRMLNYGSPYGLDEHRRQYGNGVNMLRTKSCAQARALKVGDELATGDKVTAPLRDGGNGRVWINLGNHWVDAAACIPVALMPAKSKSAGKSKRTKGVRVYLKT